jgi:PIN domain nuclease of toxin-antitoxin system
MAIKLSLGRLTLAEPFRVLIPQQLRVNGIDILNIDIAHLAELTTLPFHHRDSFDRLLSAQAIVEQCPVVTVDPAFDASSLERLW